MIFPLAQPSVKTQLTKTDYSFPPHYNKPYNTNIRELELSTVSRKVGAKEVVNLTILS